MDWFLETDLSIPGVIDVNIRESPSSITAPTPLPDQLVRALSMRQAGPVLGLRGRQHFPTSCSKIRSIFETLILTNGILEKGGRTAIRRICGRIRYSRQQERSDT